MASSLSGGLSRAWFTRVNVLIATLVVACGCSSAAPPSPSPGSEVRTAVLALNAAPQTGDFVVEATNSIRLQSGSAVHGRDIGARGTAAGPFLSGGVPLDAIASAQADIARSVIADSVHLGTGSVVGDVQTAHFSGVGSTHGSVTGLVPLPPLPAATPVVVGTTAITVGTSTIVTKAPGRFGAVTVNAVGTLRLGAGLYEFSSVTVVAGGRVEALGPVQIHIAGRWSAGDSTFLGPAAGVTLTAGGIRVEVSGQNGSTGALSATPVAAVFGVGDQVKALVLVPNGTLSIGANGSLRGAFFARDVDVGNAAQLTFEDGFASTTCPASCDDANPCTTDACVSGACTHVAAPAGTACSDGNACTTADTCSNGACLGGAPPNCDDGNVCTADSCSPTGGCAHVAAPANTLCRASAGVCDVGETCGGGTVCPADAKSTAVCRASAGACDVAESCNGTSNTCPPDTFQPSGTVCRASAGTCDVAESCSGTTNACPPDAFQPTGTVCRASAGVCDVPDSCTGTSAACAVDAKSTAVCRPSAGPCDVPEACDGVGNSCPTDGFQANGVTCNDNNGCTQTDTCQAGACTGSNPIVCAASDQCHLAGTCSPINGTCSNPVASNGTSCSDGNACTTADTCSSGACVGGAAPNCDDGNVCTTDSCTPAGGCAHTAAPPNTVCRAAAGTCDVGETCGGSTTCPVDAKSTAVCRASIGACDVAETCDGVANTCPTDAKSTAVCRASVGACDVAESCDGVANTCPADAFQVNGTSCDDGNACTTGESCQNAGTCGNGTSVNADDGNPCTADSCSPVSGVSHTPVNVGTPCSDGNACNGSETCNATGFCAAGTAPVIDDGNPCTFDGCDPSSGPTHLPLPAATSCTDSNACNGSETCDGTGVCRAGQPVAIDDGNPCTADACDAVSGVSHTPLAVGVICGSAPDGCHSAPACNGSGACQPSALLSAGTTCAPATDACHDPGTCDGLGSCRPSTMSNVNDNDACTVDSCALGTGPVHSPLAAGTLCGPSSFCDATGDCVVRVPPDPATIAPVLNTTVTSTVFDRTAFLYTGPQPSQTGVAPGTIEARRTAVVRGRILDRSNHAVAGVTVQVLGHPELGGTATRADGTFDLVVNGGGKLVISFESPGLLTVQRGVDAPWNDSVVLNDVVMIPVDPVMTPVTLGSSNLKVAQGSTVTDQDGTRRAVLFFQPGTTAEMILANGATEPLDAMSVHVTEYTQGPLGPQSMPGELPSNSGYTYAVSLVAEEAEAAGARSIQFSQPVSLYVDDFLQFPAGTIVPSGTYDEVAGAWVPEPNGRVVKIIGIQGGVATLDVDGSGNAATASALTTLGITDAERAQIAQTFASGALLWRVPVSHWSSFDTNWPLVPNDPGAPPPSSPPGGGGPGSNPPGGCGSFIELTNQTLGESVPIAGTPLSLSYRSDRVPGRREQYQIHIPITGAPPPPGPADTTIRYDVEVQVAGRTFQQSFPTTPNQEFLFEWDGLDAYGRRLQGSQPAVVLVSRVVPAMYTAPASFAASFAQYSGTGAVLTTNRARGTISITRRFVISVGAFDARPQDIAGWTLDVHHTYDRGAGVLYFGNGNRRQTGELGNIVEPFAGTGTGGTFEGLPAANAHIPGAAPLVAVGPDRSVYIGTGTSLVLRVNPQTSIVNRFAGNVTVNGCGGGAAYTSGEGGPALNAGLCLGADMTVSRDGSLLVLQRGAAHTTIRRIGTDGIIRTVAGIPFSSGIPDQSCSFQGDGGLAKNAELCNVRGLGVGPDDSIYLIEGRNPDGRVRKIGPDGIIHTLPTPSFNGFIGSHEGGIDIGPDGSVYYTDWSRSAVRRITPDGIDKVFAGLLGTSGYAGDGGAATQARLNDPEDVIVSPDGVVYIPEVSNNAIRVVTPDGVINTLAGGNLNAPSIPVGDGGPALQATFNRAGMRSGLGPDGALYVSDPNFGEVRRIRSALPGGVLTGNLLLPSDDGQQVYEFDTSGRHVRTRHAFTGGTLWTFGYDTAGRLATLTDGDGNVTTISRDAAGTPASITGPYGHVTVLGTDAQGFLSRVRDPAGGETDFTYTPAGLMTTMVDANAGLHSFSWDAAGRLTRDENPAGGFQTLAQAVSPGSATVTVATAQNVLSSYKTEKLSNLQERRAFATAIPTPTVTLLDFNKQTETTTQPDGMQFLSTKNQAPRWGMTGPIVIQSTLKTPSGVSLLTTDAQSVTLSNPVDPFSIQTFTDTAATNALSAATAFTGPTKTLTLTSPVGRITTTTQDLLGRPIQVQVSGVAPVSFVYDARGRLQSTTQDTRTTFNTYDASGNLQTITDALNQTETFDHDPIGRVTARHRADGTIIGFAYDPAGNLTAVTPPGKPPHSFTYTPENRLETYTAPDIGFGPTVTSYAYDLDSNPTSVARPDGSTVSIAYDSSGRMHTVTLPTGTMTLGYDAVTATLTSATGPYGVNLAYGYDGRLLTNTSWSGAVTGSVGRTYDGFFRVATETVNGQAATKATFGYDNDGLITSVATPAGSMALTYDPTAPRLQTTTLGQVTDSRTYDQFGQVATYTAKFGTTTLYDVAYARDALGRIRQKTETIQGTTKTSEYGYDQVGRLITVAENGAVVRQYEYDANGNRTAFDDVEHGTTTVGTYDAQDRLLTYGNLTYTYTKDGAIRTKTDTSTGQTTTYTYDALGNLTHVALPDGRAIDYVIDGMGRRVGKKVNGVLQKQWLYADDVRIVAELDGTGNVVSRFVWADGTGSKERAVDQVLTRLGLRMPDLLRDAVRAATSGRLPLSAPAYVVKDATLYRVITNHLGTPRVVVDVSAGLVAERMDLAEWGTVKTDTSAGFQPFGFAAGLLDGDTGLVRFGARDYDSVVGRWTGKDPMRIAGGANYYAYFKCDPINERDRRGLDDQDCINSCADVAGVASEGCSGRCALTATSESSFAKCLSGCDDRSWNWFVRCSSGCDPMNGVPNTRPQTPPAAPPCDDFGGGCLGCR